MQSTQGHPFWSIRERFSLNWLGMMGNTTYVCPLWFCHSVGCQPDASWVTPIMCPIMAGKSTHSKFPGNIDKREVSEWDAGKQNGCCHRTGDHIYRLFTFNQHTLNIGIQKNVVTASETCSFLTVKTSLVLTALLTGKGHCLSSEVKMSSLLTVTHGVLSWF